MTRIIKWAVDHTRTVLAAILASLITGIFAYANLPKEGEPDIQIPFLFISVPFQGISAEDSEQLLVLPMETELAGLDGLKNMSATAAEGYAGIALEFDFGWDKTDIMSQVRDRMDKAESKFPSGFEKYSITEVNFSEFPILVIALSGNVPERTLLNTAKELSKKLIKLEPVLDIVTAGQRNEMIEVIVDPLKLESYDITVNELVSTVINNNRLIAAGEINTATGSFAVKVPSSFDSLSDIYNLPIKHKGDRLVKFGDLAEVRFTFEDRTGSARYNGEKTIALQVSKRKGYNIIETTQLINDNVRAIQSTWPKGLKQAINVDITLQQSRVVRDMVKQLESSVLTATIMVVIVVLATLGMRSAILVGFSIPMSFMLCFAFLSIMGIAISNIVMFGLILAVGILVDGAIVVVEYAEKETEKGQPPQLAFYNAAKRMFWPIISSTATTLCAFLPMLFWPGVAGEFMGTLPITIMFVLSASLIVALIYLPVLGGIVGIVSNKLRHFAVQLAHLPVLVRLILSVIALYVLFVAAMQLLNPAYLFGSALATGWQATIPGAIMFVFAGILNTITLNALLGKTRRNHSQRVYKRSTFGWFIGFIVGYPIMPIIAIGGVLTFVVSVFSYYGANNNGVEFFVPSEPETAIVYIRARGNLSIEEKDALLKQAEAIVLAEKAVRSTFSFAGKGGLNQNTGGGQSPLDTIAQIQLELIPWEERPRTQDTGFWKDSIIDADYRGNNVIADLEAKLSQLPGVKTEILTQGRGPASGKPVSLRLTDDDWQDLLDAAQIATKKFSETTGLINIEDTRPLPGIDWQIDVDMEKVVRFGANVAIVGKMVQLVTNGIVLDQMRLPGSDEEIDIRLRLPKKDRVLSTLDRLKLRTADGQIPLSNFITRIYVPQLGEIKRVNEKRFFSVQADVATGLLNDQGQRINATERIAHLTKWLENQNELPRGVEFEWTGEQEEQQESQSFLMIAFSGALCLMFVILLAQFNSFYNACLILLAVILSTAGVLIGILVMDQTFSVIMTGTGIVSLAGIVVNNNIVLIDTYQEYSRYMPKIEAIVRTCESRLRPVLLTTITTMAGLTPMMLGISLNFIEGGYSLNSPAALWWKQLSTAVVFGLGIATILTLVFTPSLLALRVWISRGAYSSWQYMLALSLGKNSELASDLQLNKKTSHLRIDDIAWQRIQRPSAIDLQQQVQAITQIKAEPAE